MPPADLRTSMALPVVLWSRSRPRHAGSAVTKLGLWEPPYVLDDEPTRPPADYEAQIASAVATGRPGDAVELFFTLAVGMPSEQVAPMRDLPFWPAMEGLAQALAYDAAVMGDFRPRPEQLGKVEVPALVVDGGDRSLDESHRRRGRRSRARRTAPDAPRTAAQRRPDRYRARPGRLLQGLNPRSPRVHRQQGGVPAPKDWRSHDSRTRSSVPAAPPPSDLGPVQRFWRNRRFARTGHDPVRVVAAPSTADRGPE